MAFRQIFAPSALDSLGHSVPIDVYGNTPVLIHVLPIKVEFFRLSAHHSRAA